jgi:hypothetical protein
MNLGPSLIYKTRFNIILVCTQNAFELPDLCSSGQSSWLFPVRYELNLYM